MKAIIVVGLGYGDEGKGTIVDFLTRQHKSSLVVRFNGGFQAAHNVHTEDGRHHTFSQFGSGTFAGAETLLGAGMIINPLCHQIEAKKLEDLGIKDALAKCTVHHRCLVTTPFHKALNQIRELSRPIPHGSTGTGIGETVRLAQSHPLLTLRAGMLANQNEMFYQLQGLRQVLYSQCLELIFDHGMDQLGHPSYDTVVDIMQPFYLGERLQEIKQRYSEWANQVNLVGYNGFEAKYKNSAKPVIFEGSQGMLLDKQFGFHPHTTWGDTTDKLAQQYLEPGDTSQVIGVTRTYMTRHGAGPFVSEHFPSQQGNIVEDDDNHSTDFAGKLRTGFLDLVALKYAIKCCSRIDGIALTHCDKLNKAGVIMRCICEGYNGADLLNYIPVEASPEAFEFTAKLNKTWAMLDIVDTDPDLFVARLEKELKVPILIKSYGKTNKEKNMGMPNDDGLPEKPVKPQTSTLPDETEPAPAPEVVPTTATLN